MHGESAGGVSGTVPGGHSSGGMLGTIEDFKLGGDKNQSLMASLGL